MLFVERYSLGGTRFRSQILDIKVSGSDFRVKFEKRLQARTQLFFDSFLAAHRARAL